MSWFETLTKETFQAVVREAVKEDLETLKDGVNDLKRQVLTLARAVQALEKESEAVKQRLTKLEEQSDRIRENQTHFTDRISRLEGTLQGSLRGIVAELKLEFYEKFRGELPATTKRSKSIGRKNAKRLTD
jgi:predicted nuclease with TOPRIM domain